jgi:hypothetical protein
MGTSWESMGHGVAEANGLHGWVRNDGTVRLVPFTECGVPFDLFTPSTTGQQPALQRRAQPGS